MRAFLGFLWKLVKWAALSILTFAISTLSIFVLILYEKGFFVTPDFSTIERDRREVSFMYDDVAQKLMEFCLYCRESIPLEAMGRIPELTVAVEDKHFWSRSTAVDVWGIVRAAYINIRTGRAAQGASTISQQVARNEEYFLKEERRQEREYARMYPQKFNRAQWWRKLREAWIAIQLERTFERKKILEIYLNNAYFGHGRYGVKSAANFYFEKAPSDLTVAETALLVGLLRSPGAFSFSSPARALELRERVLEQFVDMKIITAAEKTALAATPLPKKTPSLVHQCRAEHAAEFARRQIIEKMKLVDNGIRVHTTIDCEWQKAATAALEESIVEMQQRNPELTDLRGAAVLLDVRTGAIKVFAQYPEFKENQYLADQIQRHLGSTAKIFFYTKWLENGGRLDCADEGEGPCMLDDSATLYIPMGGKEKKYIQNFPYRGIPRYRGAISALLAIAESRNAATMSGVSGIRNSNARQLVTKEEMLELMTRLGVGLPTMDPEMARQKGVLLLSPPSSAIPADQLSPAQKNLIGIKPNTIDPGLTLAIGSVDVSVLDLAVAASGILGSLVEPHIIDRVFDALNNPVDAFNNERFPRRIIDEKISLQMIRGLRATIELPHGTGQRANRELDFQVLGKTGTATDGSGETTDNWFLGCTPSYCMVIWIGRENKLPLKITTTIFGEEVQETGGRNALPVFIKTFKKVYETTPKELFPKSTDPSKPFGRTSEKAIPEAHTPNTDTSPQMPPIQENNF